MILRDARRQALPRNHYAEFEPDNPRGVSCPSANALKDGTRSEVTRVPEDPEAILGRSKLWFGAFHPQNLFQAWLVDQVSITSHRIEHIARIERRSRDRASARAVLFWDEDRRLDAEKLGARLAEEPASAVNLLRRTPQGCDWMIDRWAALAHVADLHGGWDDDQRTLAFGLLGTPREFRTGEPGAAIDLDGRAVDNPGGPAELARREVAGLMARREEVAGQDAIDRVLAEADLVDPSSTESRRLRSYETTLHQRLRWLLHQLNFDSPRGNTNPRLYDYFNRTAESDTEIEPKPEPTPEAVPTPEPLAEPEAQVVEAIAPESRPSRTEARLKKASGRREAYERKLERRRS